MFLLLSGEGKTDIGTSDDKPGPMAKFIDSWISRRSQYSLLETFQFKIISETELTNELNRLRKAKKINTSSRRGKKRPPETQYFYRNARALANLSRQISQEKDTDVIAILFRDSDGSASSGRGLWENKWDSILKGFEKEEMLTGVPMVPKPKSEAWVLCALKKKYQHCASLEDEAGNDAAPNSLKKQLEAHLAQPCSQELLNDKVDQGEIDINQIEDMPSLTEFKDRLDTVLDTLNLPRA